MNLPVRRLAFSVKKMHSNDDRAVSPLGSRRVFIAAAVMLGFSVLLLILSIVGSWRPAGTGRQNGFYAQTEEDVEAINSYAMRHNYDI